MYGSIFGGQYVYYYDFPSHVESEYSPQLLTAYPVITSENDDYTIESNRFSEYLKNIKEQCDDKIVWMISAVPDLLDSLEDVIPLRHICDYFNASDYWKKNGDWPEHVDENKLRAFNIEVLKVWLFQKTTHDFYAQNNDTPPSLNEYKMQLVINLEQFKQELLALNALNLMRSNPDQSVVKLWESLSPDGSLDKFNVFNSSAIIQMIKEQNLFPEDMRLNINPRSFEYWQQIHNTLNDELIKIINNSILNNLEKKCVQYCSDIPFEQLCKTYWPGAQRFNDNDPPLYSVSEINDFMEKILSHAGEQCKIMIEE